MMHHRITQAEYEHMVHGPHVAHATYAGHGSHSNTEAHHTYAVPVAGYWELLEDMEHSPEFPFEMYIPIYYDAFKDSHGWSYADLIQQTIYEGHSHDEAHEIWWDVHPNDMEENFSMGSLTSMGSKMMQGASQMGKTMGQWGQKMQPAFQSLSKGAQQMWQKMPDMKTMMGYG